MRGPSVSKSPPFRINSPPPELYEDARWYACQTRPRAEKKVDRLLGSLGVPSYLPLLERERQWSDREKRIGFPLFPGYIFACFPLIQLGDVLGTPSLVSVVRVNGYPTPVHERELESIRTLVDGANRTGLEPASCDYLVRGQKVRVVQGPFRGLSGILIEMRGGVRVVVQIAAIRQAISVEMGRQSIWPLEII